MHRSRKSFSFLILISTLKVLLVPVTGETLPNADSLDLPTLQRADTGTKVDSTALLDSTVHLNALTPLAMEKSMGPAGDLSEEDLAWAPQAAPSPVRFLTGHGISYGRGRTSDVGFHGLDSMSLALRQYPGSGRISEKISVATDFSFQRSELQTGNANFSLQFREQGLSLQAQVGVTYASLIYNTVSRTEKNKGQAELVSTFAASVSKAFALDVDSTWEWTLGGGYDNYGGEFKTWDGFTSLGKTWKEFDWLAEASGYQQHQSQTRTIKCKLGSGKLCAQTQDSSAVEGFSIAVFGEWDHEAHYLSVKASLDWQMTTSVQSRYRTIGVGYIYSPLIWLNLGVSAVREKALDETTGSSYWLFGSTVSLKF